ncbi:MAG: TRC40/GET3/ArsA family transport-energizing ATPase [Ardenticatenaceae bacterium]|nr:TRC40/GET3/ArsA family transport-energizing ATPase [Anaerolineales bacterium]MCB8921709.1 TRC40/GET3/ArsA family transport-energizing ATPase [Ardenticatenaceae bacterium]MCB8990772.1 TRC40/GET3/ArsA family transport-energizing ATPase [Ardenticatenaceae bacterium]MCB9003259.1 TRC40/GET3/ArsA family transport-energizing ATPase [Ardenticatenaceae bacterium]
MRIILYLGKGGVGKTTVAAATAVRSAELGYKTLVASTDIAHSLADSFDVPLSDRPVEVAPNLWAQEISVVADIHNHWGTLQNFVSGLIVGQGINNVIADELSAIPGMDEIVALLHINKQATERNFERVIIDAAPTGETIRLLTMPDTFRWYTGHINRFERGVVRALKPFAGRLLQGPAEVLEALNKLDAATAELRATLSDPEIASYRVVLQPEKMVIREAERAVSYLGLFNYPVDSVVINRILPESAAEGAFYAQRRELQTRYLEMIENNFSPLPLWRVPYYAHEVVGVEALSQLANDCFGEHDPADIFYRGSVQDVVETADGGYQLRIPMPFVSSDAVKLRKRGDELFITIGNFKREMILPTVLAKRKAVGGRLLEGVLEVDFQPQVEEGAV